MKEKNILNKIKSISVGTAGSSMQLLSISYDVLEYAINNDNYDKLINLLYDYCIDNFPINLTKQGISWKNQLESIIISCCTIIYSGDKTFINDAGLKVKNYSKKDISNFFDFTCYLNKKFDNKLNLDSVNRYQLIINQEKIKELESKSEEINNKIKKTDERIDKIHFDTVSIISIFIAVIFAIFGSINLLNNMFTNIKNINDIIKISIIFGYILFSLIYLLISVMSWYQSIKKKINIIIIVFQILFFILIILSWKIL